MESVIARIERPTMLLDEARARRNISRMAAKAHASQTRFRPHFKTHQSFEIGDWFRNVGVEQITVSSVDMALYFADHGWTDICIAFPVNVRQAGQIDQLAHRTRLHLLVESAETVSRLTQLLTAPVAVWIEVDTGYLRSGVPWDDASGLCRIAGAVRESEQLALQGLLVHAGQTYGQRASDGVRAVYDETLARLEQARSCLLDDGFPGLELSIGDTPACSLLEDFPVVDEIRPGNFVFYDLMQATIGSCKVDDIAVAVACPVVAQHPERRETIIYGGAVHLSKEVLVRPDGTSTYGGVVLLEEDGAWGEPLPRTRVRSLSQEHGIIATDSDEAWRPLANLPIGSLIGVIPVHSCLTADLLQCYLTQRGRWIAMMGRQCGG